MARTKKKKMAFIYDFDGTLAPGNMQEYSFIPDVGLNRDDFWEEVEKIEKDAVADNILAYMYLMLDKAHAVHKPVKKSDFEECGKNIKYYTGVETWFDRINKYAASKDIEIEHYIVSCGIKEMVEGTKIAKYFKQIFASSFIYDEHDAACWPAQGVNFTSKTQFLFRINKGSFDITDHSVINKSIKQDERYIPFNRMVYFGDGETDVPCMKLTKVNGGHSIAVYKPNSRKKQIAVNLLNDERVDFAVSADYSENKGVEKAAKAIIDKVASDIRMDQMQSQLNK